MVTAKNESAKIIGDLVAKLTQWVACFTASLPTDANPEFLLHASSGIKYKLVLREITV